MTLAAAIYSRELSRVGQLLAPSRRTRKPSSRQLSAADRTLLGVCSERRLARSRCEGLVLRELDC